ncbi:MAG: DUF3488 and transglutaminase-like domain-containing protein [Thermoanaerobaculia bacterium]
MADLVLDPSRLPFRREKIAAVGTLALVAPIPLGFTRALEPHWLVLYLLTLALFLAAVHRGRIICLRPLWQNVFGLAYALLFYFDLRAGSGKLLPATIHLLLFTMLAKLVSIQRERDFSIALVLCGFLFMASVATSFHFTIVLYLVAFVAVCWPVLVKWGLWRDLAGAPDEWTRDRTAQKLPSPRSTALSLVAALALATPLFLTLPRLKTPYIRGIEQGREVWTGFSENVDPDVFGVLKQSDRVYMRLTLEDPLTSLQAETLRLRALAFARYEGRTWMKPGAGFVNVRAESESLMRMPGVRAGELAARRKMSIDLLPLGSRYVPVPVGSPALRFGEDLVRGRGSLAMEFDGSRNLRLAFEPEGTVHYEALYGGAVVLDRGAPSPQDPSREAMGSERVRSWAAQIAGSFGNDQDAERACRRIEAFLATRFKYSLEIPPSGPRPIEQFLFETRAGHCENFASAMALALRELGIPTRFVTGFSGGEIGLFGRFVVIRGRDSHAWVEAWCGPERGWVTFDPTPVDGRPLLHDVPFSRKLYQVTDGVEYYFDRFVLSFGQGDQIDLINRVREAVGSLAQSMRDGLDALRSLRVRGTASRFAGAIAVVSGVTGLGLLFLLVRYGRKVGFPFGQQPVPPASAAYRRLQRLLRRRGRGLTPSSAPSETLAAAATFGERAGGLSREIVEAYVEESFGGRAAAPLEGRRLNGLVNDVRRAIRASAAATQQAAPQ